MMTFEEFVLTIKSMILDYMGKSYDDATVEITDVQKPGDVTLKGLCVRPKHTRISPTFYLNSYYDAYKEGKSVESILCEIADNPAWTNSMMANSLPDFADFDSVKDKIVAQLICRRGNERYLSEKISVPMGETKLDTMYVIELPSDDDTTATVSITSSMLDIWGVTVADIVRVANENTPRLRPVHYASMLSMLTDAFDDVSNEIGDDSGLIVCTNNRKMQGAISILYPGVADEIREQLGGDFYVLPSSIHETIIVPKHIVDDVNELYNMVHEVNESQVAPSEQLGCDVYVVEDGQLVSTMHHARKRIEV